MKRFYSRAGKIFLGITCTVFTFIFAFSLYNTVGGGMTPISQLVKGKAWFILL